MNSDIRVSLDFFRHPKTKKLKKRLGADGLIALQSLWIFAAQSRTDGVLLSMDKEDIELAADWYGDEGLFVDTLLSVGFLDEQDGVYSIHDWTVHNSYVATEEDRKDQSRFSRLAGVNRSAYQELKAKGVNAVTEEQYKELTRTKRPVADDALTTVKRPSNDRQTTVEAIDNAASSPNQTKPNQTKPNQDIESTIVDSCPEPQKSEAPDQQPEVEKENPFLTIPLVTKNKATGESDEFPIYPAQLSEWAECFPALDIPQVIREIKAWNLANPANRKTKTGILKHINGWLSKEQNKAKPHVRGQPAQARVIPMTREDRNKLACEEAIRRRRERNEGF